MEIGEATERLERNRTKRTRRRTMIARKARTKFTKDEERLLDQAWQNGLTSTKSDEQSQQVDRLAEKLGKSRENITASTQRHTA